MRIISSKRRTFRRSTRLDERLTPCQACGYVLSQRHHLLPAARYGESGQTVSLCANCHEAYHLLERGWIDIRAKRSNTRAIRLYSALWTAYGGRENPIFDAICLLVEQSETLQQHNAAQRDAIDLFMVLFAPEQEPIMEVKSSEIRRGDMVRVSDGKVVRVVSTQGGYIHTTEGTYGSWQVVKVAQA
jgi:hypothetical protein